MSAQVLKHPSCQAALDGYSPETDIEESLCVVKESAVRGFMWTEHLNRIAAAREASSTTAVVQNGRSQSKSVMRPSGVAVVRAIGGGVANVASKMTG